MRVWLAAVGAACALAGPAGAQVGGSASASGAGVSAMPGTAVGTPFTVRHVGKEVSKAAPQAGQQVGGGPLTQPYDPNRPLDSLKGAGLDPSLLVAPVAAVNQSGDGNALTRLYQRLGTTIGLFPKTQTTPPPNVTPGIFRRNHERARERLWRTD